MISKNFKGTIFLMILFFCSQRLNAQNATKPLNYNKHPYWIDMMNDPNVNYFEAVKAYNEFWSTRKKPDEENDVIGQTKSPKEKHHFFKTREQREEEEAQKYSLDVKKFEHWEFIVKPYVQDDGRILSPDEQLQLWQQQKQK